MTTQDENRQFPTVQAISVRGEPIRFRPNRRSELDSMPIATTLNPRVFGGAEMSCLKIGLLLVGVAIVGIGLVASGNRASQPDTSMSERASAPQPDQPQEVAPPSSPSPPPTTEPSAVAVINPDDQPIMPGVGKGTMALEEAKAQTVVRSREILDECISNWLESLPGATSRKQAENIAAGKCYGAQMSYLNIATRYGFPNPHPNSGDELHALVRENVVEKFGSAL